MCKWIIWTHCFINLLWKLNKSEKQLGKKNKNKKSVFPLVQQNGKYGDNRILSSSVRGWSVAAHSTSEKRVKGLVISWHSRGERILSMAFQRKHCPHTVHLSVPFKPHLPFNPPSTPPPFEQETFLIRWLNGSPVAGQPRRQQQAIYRVPAVWSCDLASEQGSQVTNKTVALTGVRL